MTAAAVTVVVPTVDRVVLLERCLRGLAAQTAVRYEVIVVHDGHQGIVRLLDDWHGRLPLRTLVSNNRGASGKRNAGWRAATTSRVAFTDDDCEPEPQWLAALMATADDEQAQLVAGPVSPHPDDAGIHGTWARTIHSREPGLYPGCNLLFERAALEKTGGFDTALPAGEDTDLAWRVVESGGRSAWAENARVLHAVRNVGFVAHLRSLPRWSTLPLVVHRHPQLRALAHRRYFWKPSHPRALLAAAGLVGAVVDRRALAAVVPLVATRVRQSGVRVGAELAAGDLAEVAVMVAGSVRHRTVLL